MTAQLPEGKPLLIIQRGPYSDSLSRSALDVAMSFAVFAQSPTVLFAGDGVRCLTAAQTPSSIGRKSLRKVIDSLPLYDVEFHFADEASLQAQGIAESQLPAETRVLTGEQIAALCNRASQVLSF